MATARGAGELPSLRSPSLSWRLAVAGLGWVLVSGCGPGELAKPTPTAAARRFTQILQQLMADAEEAARRLTEATDDLASADAFRVLDGIRREMAAASPGEPALSTWTLDGLPRSWAGPASLVRDREGDSFAVRMAGGRTWLVARAAVPDGVMVAERAFDITSVWSPFRVPRSGEAAFRAHFLDTPDDARTAPPSPAVVDLLAPDGRRLGFLEPVEPADPAARSGSLGWRAMALLVAGAAVLLARGTRRRRTTLLHGTILPALLIGLARAVALPLAGGATGPLTGASLQGSRLLYGSFRSPLDTLLTGAMLLTWAALAATTVRGTRGRARLLLLLVTAALALGAGALVLAVADDSRMNLLLAATGPDAVPRLAVQAGLLFVLWSPLLLVGSCALRRNSGVVVTAALSLLAAALGFFAIVSAAHSAAREDLIRHNLRLKLLGHEADRLEALALSREQLQADEELPARLSRAVREGRASDLAWVLWSRTELARQGYRCSLEIFGPRGVLQGAFGVEMPPPVPAGDDPSENLSAVEAAPVLFSTLSQEAPVYTSRWPVVVGQEVVGGIALYVSNEVDNLPVLLPDRPFWRQAVPGFHSPSAAAQIGGPPLALIYDRDSRLLWSAHPNPPRLPSGFDAEQVPPEGLWRDALSGGHRVRLLYFGDGNHLYAVGFHRDDLLDHAGRLFRILPVLLLIGLLGVGATLLVVRGPRGLAEDIDRAVRRLRRSFASKLVAASLLASLVPLLMLALVLRASLATQRQENLTELGVQSLGVAQRVVRDTLAASRGDGGAPLPTDETLFWISRVIRQEIDLFVNGMLAATSRRGLYASGLLPSLPDAEVYRRIVLESEQSVLSPRGRFEPTMAAISGPLDLGAMKPAVLSLSLDLQQAEVDRRIRAVRELTDLATVAVALLLVGASIALGRGMSARLSRLTAATERLAAGDEPEPVAIRSLDEVGRLTRSFNAMAKTLSEQRTTLRRRTRTLEQILRHAPAGIVSLDADGRISTINPSAVHILQAPSSPEPGGSVEALVAGSPYAVDLLDLLRNSPAADEVHEAELIPASGGEERVRAIVASLPAPVSGRLLILEDITQTIRSNRLAAWAEMARRIAHEIKNPLTPIRLSAEHLRRLHETGDPALRSTLVNTVETILSQVETLREIASDFSLYARIPALVRRPVAVDQLVAEAVEPYRAAPPEGVRIKLELAPGLPALDLDERLVKRALLNLVENSLQAMTQGGTLTVSVHPGTAGEGGGVRIQVADTGAGMDRATLERLFEPYFSTREAGTGLGLPIARRAIERHDGCLEVESAPGQGTTFTIVLPERPASGGGAVPPSGGDAPPGTGMR